MQDVPQNSTVVGIPGKVVVQDGVKVRGDLDHRNLPDPVSDKFKIMEKEIERLREEVEKLKRSGLS